MYRVYAAGPRRRASTSASAAGWRRCSATTAARIELMNGLLFSLPGTPVLYYGDEIGMGDNIYLGDRNGVRTPMQWSADRNAGFSRANPQRLYLPVIIDPEYHYEAVNVEAQQNNPHSLLWWMKRLIALRKQLPGVRPRHAGVPPARTTARCWRSSARYERRAHPGRGQPVALRAVRRAGPVARSRAWSRSRCSAAAEFPPIGDAPYFADARARTPSTGSRWSRAGRRCRRGASASRDAAGARASRGGWEALLARSRRRSVSRASCPAYLRRRALVRAARRAGCKSAAISRRRAAATATAAHASPASSRSSTPTGEPETLRRCRWRFADAARPPHILRALAAVGASRGRACERRRGRGLLYDALGRPAFAAALLDAIAQAAPRRGGDGDRWRLPAATFAGFSGPDDRARSTPRPARGRAEQHLGRLRRPADPQALPPPRAGMNPDLEVGRFLTEQPTSRSIAPLAGGLEYRPHARRADRRWPSCRATCRTRATPGSTRSTRCRTSSSACRRAQDRVPDGPPWPRRRAGDPPERPAS